MEIPDNTLHEKKKKNTSQLFPFDFTNLILIPVFFFSIFFVFLLDPYFTLSMSLVLSLLFSLLLLLIFEVSLSLIDKYPKFNIPLLQ